MAGAGRGAAGARIAARGRGRHAGERRRRARGIEQLPARRRGQQRPVPEPRARHAEPGRGAGVHPAHQQLRRRVRPQRRRAGERRPEVRGRSASRVRPTSSSAIDRSKRAARSMRRTSPSPSGAGISSAARSEDRRRCCADSSLPRSRASTIAPPRRAWRTCRPRPSAPAIFRPAASRCSTPSRASHSTATGFPPRASTPPAQRSPRATRCRTVAAAAATSSRRQSGRKTRGR